MELRESKRVKGPYQYRNTTPSWSSGESLFPSRTPRAKELLRLVCHARRQRQPDRPGRVKDRRNRGTTRPKEQLGTYKTCIQDLRHHQHMDFSAHVSDCTIYATYFSTLSCVTERYGDADVQSSPRLGNLPRCWDWEPEALQP